MSRTADNLRYLLEQAKLSENALSEKTGVPQPTINRILSGRSRDPRDSTLEPLAKHFRVSVEAMRRVNLRESHHAVVQAPQQVDRDLLRQSVLGAQRIIRSYDAVASISDEGRAELVAALYEVLAEGVGVDRAESTVAGMLRAFTKKGKMM